MRSILKEFLLRCQCVQVHFGKVGVFGMVGGHKFFDVDCVHCILHFSSNGYVSLVMIGSAGFLFMDCFLVL